MTETAITLQGQGGALTIVDSRRTSAQLLAQRAAIVDCMKSVMKPDIDYGTIPGTDKPSLFKPGSEKILALFNLACFPRIEDVSTPDTVRYRVYAAIRHPATGAELGEGVGEASSAESKYQWRAVVCAEEWEETPEDRRRRKWKKGKNGAYAVNQVRAEFEDVANTVLKMAKKRAQIDAVLTATAASDIFAQDLEDLKAAGLDPGEVGEGAGGQGQSAGPDLQRKSTPNTGQPAQASQGGQKPPASAATLTEEQGKKFWAVAISRVKDYAIILDYLKGVHGVGRKDMILQARLGEAMKWATDGTVEE